MAEASIQQDILKVVDGTYTRDRLAEESPGLDTLYIMSLNYIIVCALLQRSLPNEYFHRR